MAKFAASHDELMTSIENDILKNNAKKKHVTEPQFNSSDLPVRTNKTTNRSQINYKCNTCGKNFYDKSGLTRHSRTAIYCLNLREEQLDKIYNCDYCGKDFPLKCNLDTHTRSCKNKYYIANYTNISDELDICKELLESKNNKIKVLNEKVEELELKVDTLKNQKREMKTRLLDLEKQLSLSDGKLQGVLISQREVCSNKGIKKFSKTT